MFWKDELARLQEQKDLLVLQSEAGRQRLTVDWQRLSSGPWWLKEAGNSMKRHPALTAAAGVAAGLIAVQMLRKPARTPETIRQLCKLGAMAINGWKSLRS